MYYGLTNSLGRNFMGSRGDADAAAYIALVEAAGATVTAGQRTYINDFYVAAKADSYYTSLKRLYFPIWEVAAANAIDMITGASGTFNGGVTHAAGYVQGNGSTGYLNIGEDPVTLGMTTSNAMLGVLINQADSRTGAFECMIGSVDAGVTNLTEIRDTNADVMGSFLGFGGGAAQADISGRDGLFISNRTANNNHTLHRLTTSGFTSGTTQTIIPSAISNVDLYGLGRNSNGSLALPTNARVGMLIAGLKLSSPSTTASHLKTLWEGCTGLTLP